jgi:hypothetical protein
MSLTDAKLAKGRMLAAAKRRRIGADIDERVSQALADGVPADARAISARLRISYPAARRALIRLGLWRSRTQDEK